MSEQESDETKKKSKPSASSAGSTKLAQETNDTTDQTRSSQEGNNGNQKPSKLKRFKTWVKQLKDAERIALAGVMVNSAMFLITLLYIVFTGQSLHVASETLKNNNTQFELSHRPFIQIADISVDSIEENQRPNIRFNLVNTGSFPAQISQIITLMGIGGRDGSVQQIIKASETSPYKTIDSAQEIISSSGVLARRVVTRRTPIDKDTSDKIKKGDYQFFLRVEIKYIDFVVKTHYFQIDVYFIDVAPKFNIFIGQATEGTF